MTNSYNNKIQKQDQFYFETLTFYKFLKILSYKLLSEFRKYIYKPNKI